MKRTTNRRMVLDSFYIYKISCDNKKQSIAGTDALGTSDRGRVNLLFNGVIESFELTLFGRRTFNRNVCLLCHLNIIHLGLKFLFVLNLMQVALTKA